MASFLPLPLWVALTHLPLGVSVFFQLKESAVSVWSQFEVALQLETKVSDSHRRWGSIWQTGLNKVALLFYIPCTTSTGEEFAFSKPSYTKWSQDCVLLARGHTHNPTCLLSPPYIHGKSFTYVQSLPSSLQLVGPNAFTLTKKLHASLADVLTRIRMDLQPLQVPFPEFLFAFSLIMHLSFSAPG